MEEKIKQEIATLEAEMAAYRTQRNEEFQDYLRKTGLSGYIQETSIGLARFEGKIEALKGLLPEPTPEPEALPMPEAVVGEPGPEPAPEPVVGEPSTEAS